MIARTTALHDDDQQNQTNTAIPTLWVDDVLSGRHLHDLFHVMQYSPGETLKIEPGSDHYILHTSLTPEALTKALAWSILANGGECRVYGTNNTLENLVGDKLAARDLTIQIFQFSRPYEEWATRNDETKLTLKQAAEIAKVAIALLPEPQKSIELGTLRERCNQNSYDWNKLMSKIEQEFKRELERRGIVYNNNDLDERLKQDLLALLTEPDPIKKLRKRAEISSFYRMKTKEVEEALKLLSKRTTEEEIKAWSVDELFVLESEGLQWLIPELLPKGETIILAASPKAGKTLLAIDAAFAIATGESTFLGQTVPRGKVLLISADESLTSTRDKLLKRGFRSGDNDIRIIQRWTINDLDVLEKHLEDFRPNVVIIDSLRRITHGSQISENSAEFADNIYTLKETIGKYGASGILIHHTSKNPEAMGVGKIRGSSAIAGAVWGTWQLDHIPLPDPNNKKKLIIDPKDPRRVLSIFPRDAEGQCLNIEFNPEDNSWSRLDEDIQVEQQTFRQRIISVLTKNSHLQGLSGREIIELLGMTPDEGRGIYSELNRMINKRLISCKPGTGDKRINIYSLPEPEKVGDSPPPIPIVSIREESAESYIQQDFNHTQPDTQQVINNYLEKNKENQVAEDSNSLTASDSEILNNESSKFVESVSPQSELKYSCESENNTSEESTEVTPPSTLLVNFRVGDVVQVLGNRKLKNKRVTVSTINSTGIWVKEQKTGFSPPSGPFQPHQLKRC